MLTSGMTIYEANGNFTSTLAPGGCITAAYGYIDQNYKPFNLTLYYGEQNATSQFFKSEFTAMLYWAPYSNETTKCTIPDYKDAKELSPYLIEPIEVSIHATYSKEFTSNSRYGLQFQFGCGNLPLNGSYYIQFWGQSHTSKQTNGSWNVLPTTLLTSNAKVSIENNTIIFGSGPAQVTTTEESCPKVRNSSPVPWMSFIAVVYAIAIHFY